jgi:hypothetical protein
MTDWVTLADVGTAAGTLVLAGATFVAVRASARSTAIAERALLTGQRPVLVPAGPDDPAASVQFTDGCATWEPTWPHCADTASRASRAPNHARPPRGGRAPAGCPPPEPLAFSRQQRDLLISTSRAGFWQAA